MMDEWMDNSNYSNYNDYSFLFEKRVVTKIDNKELLKEIIISKDKNQLTDRAAKLLYQLGNGVSMKKRFNTKILRDCKQGAFLHLYTPKVWKSFDETKYNNAFAYYTEIYKRALTMEFNYITHTKSPSGTPMVKILYTDMEYL